MDDFKNKFIGYPEEFYRYGIPFDFNSKALEETFEEIAEKISNIDNVPNLIREYSLPKSKSFKRIIYDEPGFLFYLPEIKKTWELVGNLNLLNKILKTIYIGDFLSVLHSLPKTEKFFCEYINYRGAKEFVRLIANEWFVFFNYAAVYLLMDDKNKAISRKYWNYKYFKDMEANATFPESYSLLKPAVNSVFKSEKVDDLIEGFRFILFRSTGEYYIASELLHNCLNEAYRWAYSDVVGVYKGEDIVGAIEISNNRVVQAKSAHNKLFNEIDGLEEAFSKWMDKYELPNYAPDLILYSEEDSILVGLLYNTKVSNAPIVTFKKLINKPMDEELKQFDSLPCVDNPSLSRIIFFTADLFGKIPSDIYSRVAEIFAKEIFVKCEG